MKLTTKNVNEALKKFVNISDAKGGFGRKGEGWIIRRGYFYTNGFDSGKLADKVNEAIKKSGLPLEVLDDGDHWAAFRGGDSLAKGSHWWVIIGEKK